MAAKSGEYNLGRNSSGVVVGWMSTNTEHRCGVLSFEGGAHTQGNSRSTVAGRGGACKQRHGASIREGRQGAHTQVSIHAAEAWCKEEGHPRKESALTQQQRGGLKTLRHCIGIVLGKGGTGTRSKEQTSEHKSTRNKS